MPVRRSGCEDIGLEAAGSAVAFLLWVYYDAQIVSGGAVLTKILDDRSGLTS